MNGPVEDCTGTAHIRPSQHQYEQPTGRFEKVRPQQGHSPFDARSAHSVREHGKMATCLREAASAKAGNAAGGFFQYSLKVILKKRERFGRGLI